MTTAVEPPTSLTLEVPPEPAELRAELRQALLGGAEWTERFGADLGIGAYFWEQWGGVLEPAGMRRAVFTEVVAGYRRELWYWLLGDRIWTQTASGLAGRLVRRLPPA